MSDETSTKIINILNRDPKAKRLISMFNDVAKKNNFTDEQYDSARIMMLMIAIKHSPEAFKTLSDDVWNYHNKNRV